MSDAAEKKIAELEQMLRASNEMLALVLNEVGPVEIDKNNRKPVPPGAQIMVDIDGESNTVTISLVAADEQ